MGTLKHQDAVDFLLANLDLPRQTTVVDVGANPRGEQAPYANLLSRGACNVVGFEPNPTAYAGLEPDPTGRATYHPFAVGDGSEKIFKIYKDDSMGSIYEPYLPGTKLVPFRNWFTVLDRVPMKTVALDQSADIRPFDLLKIDIQGGEIDVFRGARKMLAEAVAVIVEVRYFRLYENEPMFGGVDCELRDQGFEIHKFRFNKSKGLKNSQSHRLRFRPNADQLIDGDVIYVRDVTRLENMTNAQLSHLAVLSAAIFDSNTLCLVCLDELVRRGVADAGLPEKYVDRLPIEDRIE